MFVKPGPQKDNPSSLRVVRRPNLQILPPEGAHVDASDPFWIHRLRDSDVIPAEPPSVEHEEGQQS